MKARASGSGSLAARQWSGVETAGIGGVRLFPAGERESVRISRRSLQGELKAWLSRVTGNKKAAVKPLRFFLNAEGDASVE